MTPDGATLRLSRNTSPYTTNVMLNKECFNFIVTTTIAEVESLRTSLTSRTYFEVLGLGLEAQVLGLGLKPYKFSKIPLLGSRTALFLDCLKRKQPT